ncbi:unnamed protein product, partial [Vitis vinifera]
MLNPLQCQGLDESCNTEKQRWLLISGFCLCSFPSLWCSINANVDDYH